MPHWPALALISAEWLALTALIARGWIRRYPAFGISLIAGLLFESQYQPWSPEWLRRWYWLGAGVTVMWRSVAFLEAWLYRVRPFPRRGTLFAMLLSVSLMAGASAAWAFRPAGVVWNLVQIRRAVVITEAVFLLASWLFFRENPHWQPDNRGDVRHVCMQTLLAWAYAASAILRLLWGRGAWWYRADVILYGATAALYLLWIAVMWNCPPPRAAPAVSLVQSDQSTLPASR